MCGLVCAWRYDGRPVSKLVAKIYQDQKTRGMDGYGWVSVSRTAKVVRYQTEKEALQALTQDQAEQILFHHRLPTSAPNLPPCNHPLRVEHKDLKRYYYLIHNGVITNASTLRDKHERAGFKYRTQVKKQITYRAGRQRYETEPWVVFNDSEALAWDLALYLEGRQPNLEVSGSVAFVLLETNKNRTPLRLHFGRNMSNPLILRQTPEQTILSSEAKDWRDSQSIMPDQLYTLDYKTGQTINKHCLIGLTTGYNTGYNTGYGRWKPGLLPGGMGQPEDSGIVTLDQLEYDLEQTEEEIAMWCEEIKEAKRERNHNGLKIAKCELKVLNRKRANLQDEVAALSGL